MSSAILPRPAYPNLEATYIYDAAGQIINSTRYSDYHSLVQHTSYLRVLEDITIVEDITPGYSSARQTRNGHRVLYGLKKGDVVKILERWWEDYWLGECHGRSGFFLLDHRFVSHLFCLPQTYLRRIFSLGIYYDLESSHNLVTPVRR
jgi:Variant SH3 domain